MRMVKRRLGYDLWTFMISISRRLVLAGAGGVALAAACPAGATSLAAESTAPPAALIRRALGAAERHRGRFATLERVGIVDFTRPSSTPRFHILDTITGRSRAVLVAHGRGSDPEHSGWLERFSNLPRSQASSAGAYLTGEIYAGRHGRSRRLIGLDPGNSNAEARAIVIHAAAYVGDSIAQEQGKIGRSEGCLAVSPEDIAQVLERLPAGFMIYADRLSA